MPALHSAKLNPYLIRSSNDVHSENSPTILAKHSKLSHEEMPAGVWQREGMINEMGHEKRQAFHEERKRHHLHHMFAHFGHLHNNQHPINKKDAKNAAKAPKYESHHGEEGWSRRLKEKEAESDEAKERFAKLRTDHRNLTDAEKHAQAAARVKVNHEKINSSLPLSARPYTVVPPAPVAILSDMPDSWYTQHRQTLKQEQLLKEQQRQSELANEKVESNNSFGFKVKKVLSDTGAKLDHTSHSVSKASQNKAIEHYEMHAHERLAKYWPNLNERFVCSFDVEAIHDDYPIAGHLILTEKSLCFVGKGTIRHESEMGENMDASPLNNTNASFGRNSTTSRLSDTTSSSSSKLTKQQVLITHTLPLCNILSYGHGVVVNCHDKHKAYVSPIPSGAAANAAPNALILYARDGFSYQFRHFRSSSASASLLKDGHSDSYYDRFVNFFDHTWRAGGNPQPIHRTSEGVPAQALSTVPATQPIPIDANVQ